MEENKWENNSATRTFWFKENTMYIIPEKVNFRYGLPWLICVRFGWETF